MALSFSGCFLSLILSRVFDPAKIYEESHVKFLRLCVCNIIFREKCRVMESLELMQIVLLLLYKGKKIIGLD